MMANHRIVPRHEWGAALPKRPLSRLDLPVRELWIHHTVTAPTKDPHRDARTVQQVAFGRGFTDVSYSYLIHPDGTLLEGRGLHVGAHTRGRNEVALAAAFIGNYERYSPTAAQLESARWLREHLHQVGALSRGCHLRGHRDNPLSPSACPGTLLYRRIPEIAQAPASPPEPPTATGDDIMRLLKLKGTNHWWLHCYDGLIPLSDEEGLGVVWDLAAQGVPTSEVSQAAIDAFVWRKRQAQNYR